MIYPPSYSVGGGGAPAPTMPIAMELERTQIFLFEDFLLYDAENDFSWDKSAAGGSGVTNNGGGWARVGVAAGTAHFEQGVLTWRNSILGDIVDVEWRIDANGNPTTTYGLMLTDTGTEDIEFRINAAGAIFCRTVVGGVQVVNQDSGVVLSPGVPQRLRIVVTSTNTTWFINGVQVHTVANPGVNFTLGFWMVRFESVSAAVAYLYVDLVKVIQTLAAARNP